MATISEATRSTERIETLDLIRGFALLGILVMNVQSFAMPSAAYLNPTAYGDLTGWNYAVWYLAALLADTKFMTLFSTLFGAGIALMAQRAKRDGRPATALHYRRMAGLFVIGMVHAYVFWIGDILVPYAICGCLIYPLIGLRCRYLLGLAVGLLLIRIAIDVLFGWSMPQWDEAAAAQVAAEWRPDAQMLSQELAAYRGGWLEQSEYRVPGALSMQLFVFPVILSWRIGAMMLIGAALMKMGVLSGRRSIFFYQMMTVIGLAIGLPVVAWGIWQHEQHQWDVGYSFFFGQIPNFVGSLFVAAGYIGGLEWIRRTRVGPTLANWLVPVGKTALTNYLMQTLICTTLFYGHVMGWLAAAGWFGSVSRVQQAVVVVAIWALQLIASRWWVSRFRFGPMEYVWRWMTYAGRPARSSAMNSVN
ncbi:DUF418 domain-containing protein [Crateriforma conspicua]|uniref:DUF418 domain-containing protein n=1 Tax=Crateriforma conspicua TaxID=2527996 RepID=UPI00118932CF|nr:DUF418 domain-containing protein [Crateriforma conspicua]QDV64333.1 hypothetical protein Mal65_34870 [Crateriforma conspicua]